MRYRSEDKINLFLVRHGSTRSNLEKRYLGKTEEPLCDEGKAALREAKEKRFYPEADLLFSSPMQRCRQTAGILYPQQKIHIIPEWEEMDFGELEGKNYRELKGNETYQKWIDSGGTLSLGGGEDRNDFIERCRKGFMRMCQLTEESMKEELESERTLGLILHGGTIMALLSTFGSGDYYDYQIGNGDGYFCRMERNEKQVKLTDITPLREKREE